MFKLSKKYLIIIILSTVVILAGLGYVGYKVTDAFDGIYQSSLQTVKCQAAEFKIVDAAQKPQRFISTKDEYIGYIDKLDPKESIFINKTPSSDNNNFSVNTKPEASLVFALNQCFSKPLKFGQYTAEKDTAPLSCRISEIKETSYSHKCAIM